MSDSLASTAHMPVVRPPRSWPTALLVIAILAVGGAALLGGAFTAPYLDFDDKKMIEENPLSQEGFTASALETIGRPPIDGHRGFYRQYIPLTYITLGLQWALHGPLMWAFRLVNLLFHAGSALLLFSILRRLLPQASWVPAALGAALFYLHPTCVESVAWAAERNNVQGLFFAMLAWWLSVQRRGLARDGTRLTPPRFSRFTLALAAFTCALLSKPSAIGFVPLLLLVELLWIQGSLLGRLLRGGAYVVLGLLASYIAIHAGRADLLPVTGGSHEAWALTSFTLLGRAAAHTLFPWPLSFFYGIETVDQALDPMVGISAAFLSVLLLLSLWLPVERRVLAVLLPAAILAFATKLTPRTNAYLFQDRYLYFSLPLAAAILAAAFEAWQYRLRLLGPQLGAAMSRGALVTAILACVACSGLSLQRSFDFGDSERLFRDAAEKQPRSYFAHYLLAQKLLVRGITEPPPEDHPFAILEEARQHALQLRLAVDRDRQNDSIAPRLLEGEIDFRLYLPTAREHLEFVVRHASPGQVFFRTKARWFLADLALREFLKTRRREPLEERKDLLRHCLEENPGNAQLLVARGETLEALGFKDEAVASFRDAESDPSYRGQAQAGLARLGETAK